MKSCTLLFIAVILSLSLQAQGTLQFNQAKLISTTQTVPANKVWKVVGILASSDLSVSGSMSTAGTASSFTPSTQISIDGSVVYLSQSNAYVGPNSGSSANWRVYGTASLDITPLPIWLPAGTTLAAGVNVARVSVIEFNIIP